MKKQLLVLLLLLLGINAYAELKLPYIISDNMMLQRNKEACIWGKGDDGTKVTVSFKNQVKTTVVKDSKWLVSLDPEKAGGPYEMKITHGDETKTIKNILIGEVWLAAGQSNMQMTLSGAKHGQEVIKEPANDKIRLFKQERQTTDEPVFDVLETAWRPADEGSRRHMSAVAYYFVRDLQKALGVPVGLLVACDGGTKTQFWTPLQTFKETPGYESILAEAIKVKETFAEVKKKWEDDLAKFMEAKKAGKKGPPAPTYYGRVPCVYYNGMIHPIQNYTIRGVIWYQGERNSMTTRDSYDYRRFLPLMIKGWRDVFHEPELPFFFVQLPRMTERNPRDLPPTRESQMLTEKNVKNTGMVVTIDIDEASLHPKLKRPIGHRLAALARAKVYGENIEYTGARFKKATVKGSEIIVSFDDVGKGLMSKDDQPLKGFAICGPDRKFVEAKAEVVGDTVVVSSDAVTKPVAVRYGWKNDAIVNLFSKNGFPVGPFRSDDFDFHMKGE